MRGSAHFRLADSKLDGKLWSSVPQTVDCVRHSVRSSLCKRETRLRVGEALHPFPLQEAVP